MFSFDMLASCEVIFFLNVPDVLKFLAFKVGKQEVFAKELGQLITEDVH